MTVQLKHLVSPSGFMSQMLNTNYCSYISVCFTDTCDAESPNSSSYDQRLPDSEFDWTERKFMWEKLWSCLSATRVSTCRMMMIKEKWYWRQTERSVSLSTQRLTYAFPTRQSDIGLTLKQRSNRETETNTQWFCAEAAKTTSSSQNK